MSAVADFTDQGQALELITDCDTVVTAAIPARRIKSEPRAFRINACPTYSVLAEAVAALSERVVWAGRNGQFCSLSASEVEATIDWRHRWEPLHVR